jgi:tetratricopeptide (TPR) repeat protein
MTQPREDRAASDRQHRQVEFRSLTIFSVLLLLFSLPAMMTSGKVYGRTGDLIRQSANEPSGAGNKGEIQALEPGKPIGRELAGGQQHTYQVTLIAHLFLKVVVEQHGIDVVTQVSGPDGKQIMEFDSEGRLQRQEEVSLVAEATGDFRLIVRAKQKGAPAGSYEIRVAELRLATDTDRALHDARKHIEESFKLQRAGKYDEALPLAESALEIRERLLGKGDRDVAAAIDGIAGVYINRGEYGKAEPLYRRALAIREKALGKDHPYIATSLNDLAALYQMQGEIWGGRAAPQARARHL